MREVALIGGIPSSGSTLLMRLLSERGNCVCLPETGLFAHGQYLLDFKDIDPRCTDLRFAVPWLDTGAKVRESLGVDAQNLDAAFSGYRNSFEFVEDRFGEPGCQLVEKTPENVFSFDVYLSRFPEARVAVTCRDSLGVVQSMMRRGFLMEEAFLIWFGHAFAICELLKKYPGQVFLCDYAQLSVEPEVTVDAVAGHLLGKGHSGKGRCRGQKYPSLAQYMSWGLEGRAWSRHPGETVRPQPLVNYLGNRFVVMRRRVGFEVASGMHVTAEGVEAVLRRETLEVASFQGGKARPVDIVPKSLIIRTLLAKYPMHVIEC